MTTVFIENPNEYLFKCDNFLTSVNSQQNLSDQGRAKCTSVCKLCSKEVGSSVPLLYCVSCANKTSVCPCETCRPRAQEYMYSCKKCVQRSICVCTFKFSDFSCRMCGYVMRDLPLQKLYCVNCANENELCPFTFCTDTK